MNIEFCEKFGYSSKNYSPQDALGYSFLISKMVRLKIEVGDKKFDFVEVPKLLSCRLLETDAKKIGLAQDFTVTKRPTIS